MADDESKGLDNVVRPAFSVIGLRQGRCMSSAKKASCFHWNHAVVDVHARVVECSACRTELDPIAVLDRIAHRADTFRWMTAEEKRLRAAISELKEEVKRLKAAKRRAAKGVDPASLKGADQ